MTKKRELELYVTHGERIVAIHYSKSNLITCGICGNQTPEELYLKNDCPHCQMGIDYEVESEGSEEKLSELEKSYW